ncbi:FAD-dependent oxidoreductase [Mycolicibacterium smegmatis]|uniref:FAD-dependent oxidoreductase n=1 Tax=Mycolicibacterium smegmatis TaxID=1772 RepID=UPI001E49A20D|nr:FAD-dependent oxidoreductase [Mycolicibacterium smegmatis]UGU29933.1 FAD-dependent oxidoreductase [Mycolicibacterium smegmatis]
MYGPHMANISGAWRLQSDVNPHRLPLVADVDVAVVGAGAAGVAAATVAAEAGLSVIVVEKYGFAGGAAVAGMSGTICGMYLASDGAGRPERVVRGFTERFAGELAVRGGLTKPQRYGKTFTVAHDPLVWREVADDLLTAAGVRILYHTQVIDVLTEDDAYLGLVLASNAGVGVVRAARIIDASGDGAVVSRGGGGYRFGDHGRIQNPTMFFRLGNVDLRAFWAAWGPNTISPQWVSDAIDRARTAGLDLPRNKIWIFDTTRPGELLVNATRLTAPDGRMLNVIDPADFTIAEVAGRRQVRAYARFLAESVPGCAQAFVVDTGVEAGIRQTRTVDCIATLRDSDVVDGTKHDDSICRSPWPIELHDGEKPKLHWLLDDYYDIPYGTLVPRIGENIIVAGRCLSAEHQALASARVTAQCFEYGHAAAVATALSLARGTAYRHLDPFDIQTRMIANGSALQTSQRQDAQ